MTMTINKVSEITGVSESFIKFYIRLFNHKTIRNKNGYFIRDEIYTKEVPFIKWWYNIGRPSHKKTGKSPSWRQKIHKEFLDYYGLDEHYYEELAEQ